jgi:hypothetical protein
VFTLKELCNNVSSRSKTKHFLPSCTLSMTGNKGAGFPNYPHQHLAHPIPPRFNSPDQAVSQSHPAKSIYPLHPHTHPPMHIPDSHPHCHLHSHFHPSIKRNIHLKSHFGFSPFGQSRLGWVGRRMGGVWWVWYLGDRRLSLGFGLLRM